MNQLTTMNQQTLPAAQDAADQLKGAERIYQAVRDHLTKHKVAIEAKVHEAVFDYMDASGFDLRAAIADVLGNMLAGEVEHIAQLPTGSRTDGEAAQASKPVKTFTHEEASNAHAHWTEDDHAKLRALYPKFRDDYIAEELGRSESAITSQASTIGVRKAPGYTRKRQLVPAGWKPKADRDEVLP